MQELIPSSADVVFLGDGEFDGTELQKTLEDAGWSYVCRTALTTTATLEGERFRLDVMGACIKPGMIVAFQNVRFTAAAYGPVTTICCWGKGCKEPLDPRVDSVAVWNTDEDLLKVIVRLPR